MRRIIRHAGMSSSKRCAARVAVVPRAGIEPARPVKAGGF
jgi:hypothetical protein